MIALKSLLMLAALPALASLPWTPEGYSSRFPKQYPVAYRLWRDELPDQFASTAWLARLEGVVSPMRRITVGGVEMIEASACKPHDCGDNHLELLFSPDQSRVVASARVTNVRRRKAGIFPPTALVLIGEPNRAEAACLEALHREPSIRSC